MIYTNTDNNFKMINRNNYIEIQGVPKNLFLKDLVNDEVESIYQTVHFFIRSKTGMWHVATFKYCKVSTKQYFTKITVNLSNDIYFLSRSAMPDHDLAICNMSICLSVTRWY